MSGHRHAEQFGPGPPRKAGAGCACFELRPAPGTSFTCFISTKVLILTPEELRASMGRGLAVMLVAGSARGLCASLSRFSLSHIRR